MENEWGEGPASRCVGTVWRSTADDTTRSEAGYCGKMLRRERVRKPEGEICPAIRRRATDRGGSRRVFLLWRVVSCGDAALGWRTKLHLDSGEPSTTAIGPPHLGQDQRSLGLAVEACCSVCGVPPSSWKESGKVVDRLRLARKQKLRMRTKPSGSRCNRKRRKNSSRDRVINFCSLLWAESRQRKVTFPSANETRRWLEMATR